MKIIDLTKKIIELIEKKNFVELDDLVKKEIDFRKELTLDTVNYEMVENNVNEIRFIIDLVKVLMFSELDVKNLISAVHQITDKKLDEKEEMIKRWDKIIKNK